jgi:uncharacterized membrane protein (DUF485 family)
MSEKQLSDKRTIRSYMLDGLKHVVSNDTSSETSVINFASLLNVIVGVPQEISSVASMQVSNVALNILERTTQESYTDLESLLGAADSALSVIGRTLLVADEPTSMEDIQQAVEVVSCFGDLVLSQQTIPDDKANYIYPNFRMVSQAAASITSPRSDMEKLRDLNSSLMIVATIKNQTALSDGSMPRLQAMELNPNFWRHNESIDRLQSKLIMVKTVDVRDVTITVQKQPRRGQTLTNADVVQNLTTHCQADQYLNDSFVCPGSNVEIVNKCQGKEEILVNLCPIQTIGCLSLSLADQQIDIHTHCVVINETVTEVTCQCNIHLQPVVTHKFGVRNRRRLQSTGNEAMDGVLYETGALTMGLMIYYVANEFKNTFNAAPNAMSSAQDTERVLIVLTMFISLWSIGFVMIGVMFWRQKQVKDRKSKQISQDPSGIKAQNGYRKHRSSIRKSLQLASATLSTEQLKTKLANYVFSVMPIVFTKQSLWKTIKHELSRHHVYWKLWSRSPTDRLPVLMVCQILTSHTLTMFLLAILYDLQGPDDNGTCLTHSTEVTCLERKSLFDSTQTYCKWSAQTEYGIATNPNHICTYNHIDYSFQVMSYCAVVGSVFTALLMRPVDYCFLILSSPLKNSAAIDIVTGSRDHLSLRRSNVQEDASNIEMSLNNMKQLRTVKQLNSKFIPEETRVAHNQAVMSMNIYSNDIGRKMSINRYNNVLMKRDSWHNEDPKLAFERLVERLTATRNLLVLRCKNHYDDHVSNQAIDLFENAWDLDSTTGRFRVHPNQSGIKHRSSHVVPQAITKTHYNLHESHTITIILDELETVQHEVELSLQALRCAVSDEQRGIEILNLFILDLLGRDTPEANIYREKTDEDYTSLKLVSKTEKLACALGLFVLNAFFVYFALLRGYQKGLKWQKAYLMTCIFEVIADILMFQTCECLYVNVFLPRLVS